MNFILIWRWTNQLLSAPLLVFGDDVLREAGNIVLYCILHFRILLKYWTLLERARPRVKVAVFDYWFFAEQNVM